MHIQPTPEDLIMLTEQNPFERFADGRPRMPDDLFAHVNSGLITGQPEQTQYLLFCFRPAAVPGRASVTLYALS